MFGGPRTEETERVVGVPVPDDLVDLFRVANGIYMFSGFEASLSADRIGWRTRMLREQEAEAVARGPEPGIWRGEPPTEDFVVFGSCDYLSAAIEVGGPRHGRVLVIEGPGEPNTAGCWGPIGDDIEAVLRWSLELAVDSEAYGDPFIAHRSLSGGTMIWFNDERRSTPEYVPHRDPFVDNIRPVIARHGGTPAAFNYYDTPAPYHWPPTPRPSDPSRP